MKKYQIRFTDKKGRGSFAYFEAEEKDRKLVAAIKANEYINRGREHNSHRFFFEPEFTPIRTVSVVEYDQQKHCTKRGGEKFKLRLRYFEAKFTDGTKKRDEWYDAD